MKPPPPDVEDGPVTLAVRRVIDDLSLGVVGEAQAALAMQLSRLVDEGSVPAARELRPLLVELGLAEDDETAAFLESIKTPGLRRDP